MVDSDQVRAKTRENYVTSIAIDTKELVRKAE